MGILENYFKYCQFNVQRLTLLRRIHSMKVLAKLNQSVSSLVPFLNLYFINDLLHVSVKFLPLVALLVF